MLKQVIIVRKDLDMGKGKICAQVAHASLEAYLLIKKEFPEKAEKWRKEGAKKIVLKVNSLQDLLFYFEKFREKNIPVVMIRDRGYTQVEPNTITCIAAGPWEEEEIDVISGHLKLL